MGAHLDDDWYVVVLDRYGHELVSDGVLARVSRLGDVVAGAAEEHVMCSFSCAWRHGQRLWWAMHDAQRAIDHLEVDGTMPRGFDEIRRAFCAQHLNGSAAGVDYIYDIPLETAKLASGFSYDETEPDDGFAVLASVE